MMMNKFVIITQQYKSFLWILLSKKRTLKKQSNQLLQIYQDYQKSNEYPMIFLSIKYVYVKFMQQTLKKFKVMWFVVIN